MLNWRFRVKLSKHINTAMVNTDLFNLENKEAIRDCLPVLTEFFSKYKEIYINLFFQEKDVEFDKLDLSPLLNLKLIKIVGGKYRANVFIFPLSGKFIVCDFLISIHRTKNGRYLRRRDDVWAVLAYESPYLAKRAIVKKGDTVLDLATGSGIIALFCAEKAKKVIATDINPKALNYAKFNAILNGLEKKIEFRLGDLFEPVKGEKFDLIIWNGPTIATPNLPTKYPIYCFGGADGLGFTGRFINEAASYLSRNGRMQWLDPSLGNDHEPKSLSIVRDTWKDKKFRVVYEERVKPSNVFEIYEYLDRALFKPGKILARPLWIEPITDREYSGWLDFLKKNNLSHIYAGMYEVYPSDKMGIEIRKPKKIQFPWMNYLPQDWHFLGSSRIRQLLRICEDY